MQYFFSTPTLLVGLIDENTSWMDSTSRLGLMSSWMSFMYSYSISTFRRFTQSSLCILALAIYLSTICLTLTNFSTKLMVPKLEYSSTKQIIYHCLAWVAMWWGLYINIWTHSIHFVALSIAIYTFQLLHHFHVIQMMWIDQNVYVREFLVSQPLLPHENISVLLHFGDYLFLLKNGSHISSGFNRLRKQLK